MKPKPVQRRRLPEQAPVKIPPRAEPREHVTERSTVVPLTRYVPKPRRRSRR